MFQGGLRVLMAAVLIDVSQSCQCLEGDRRVHVCARGTLPIIPLVRHLVDRYQQGSSSWWAGSPSVTIRHRER